MNRVVISFSFVLIIYCITITGKSYSQNSDSAKSIWSSISKYDVDSISGYYFNPIPPNPFGPSTFLHFYIPQQKKVRITLIDTLHVSEFLILNSELEKGFYVVHWDITKINSGKYYCKFETNDFSKSEIYYIVK